MRRLRGDDRELDAEAGAGAFAAFDVDGSAVGLDDLFDDDQAESEGAFAGGSGAFGHIVDGE